jgi:predicted GNAT family N-acyltransferase
MQIVIEQATQESDFAICMAIRMEIFVFEQNVPAEEEWDGYDKTSTHFFARVDGKPTATARLRDTDGIARIERMAVRQNARRTGVGKHLLQHLMDYAKKQGFKQAFISAQTHAVPFYEKLGFKSEGEEYMESGIPHFAMRTTL